jgi:hypothetical protein
MTVARQPRSVTFTAVNEGIVFPYLMLVVGITFQGAGLTAAQRITVRDTGTPGSGSLLADYVTKATTADDNDLWGAKPPQPVTGLSIDNGTVAGTWVVTVFIRD